MDEALLMQEGSFHTSEQKGGLYAHMCMQAAFSCEDDRAIFGCGARDAGRVTVSGLTVHSQGRWLFEWDRPCYNIT